MKHIWKRIIFFTIGLVGGFVAILATTQPAYLAPLLMQGETESFRYAAQIEGANNLVVTVGDFFDTPEQLAKYRQANRRRNQALSESATTNIPVQITFQRPLPQAEARALTAKAGLTVKDFTMVGHSETSKQRGGHFELGPLDKEVETQQDMGPDQEKLILAGVMIINGTVADGAGLKRLEADNRIYLVDTTEVQVRELLQKQHRAWLNGKTVVVAVPSPYWRLDW